MLTVAMSFFEYLPSLDFLCDIANSLDFSFVRCILELFFSFLHTCITRLHVNFLFFHFVITNVFFIASELKRITIIYGLF